ncbi:MAG: nucleotidyltransferase domain-containing protein [Coriobacteriia bacterium]|nr:nucleotidyltransferase domain-containing protein [Coriobacteriia bacterium]
MAMSIPTIEQVSAASMTRAEVMDYLSVGKSRIPQMVRTGDIMPLHSGGFYRPSVEAYKKKRGNKKGGPYPKGSDSYDFETLKQSIADVLREYDYVEQASIFGSYARGEAGESSDLDLAVTYRDDDALTLLDIGGLKYNLEEATGKEVDILDDYQISEIRAKRPRFIKNLERDMELIYER